MCSSDLQGNAETHDPIFRSTPVSVVRKGDWKLIQYYETNTFELFNLRSDISEKKDLSNIEVAKTEALKSILSEWQQQVNAPIPTQLNPKYVQ